MTANPKLMELKFLTGNIFDYSKFLLKWLAIRYQADKLVIAMGMQTAQNKPWRSLRKNFWFFQTTGAQESPIRF